MQHFALYFLKYFLKIIFLKEYQELAIIAGCTIFFEEI